MVDANMNAHKVEYVPDLQMLPSANRQRGLLGLRISIRREGVARRYHLELAQLNRTAFAIPSKRSLVPSRDFKERRI